MLLVAIEGRGREGGRRQAHGTDAERAYRPTGLRNIAAAAAAAQIIVHHTRSHYGAIGIGIRDLRPSTVLHN